MVEALVDGQASDCVPPDDRGLLYGDHLFETVAFVDGRAPLWRLHMRRLARDCERLLIPPPDEQVLAAECARLAPGRSRCVVRISVTRGSGGRAYEPPSRPVPRRILLRRPWPADLASARRDGIVLHASPVRLALGGPLAGIKHGNRLEQVLAAEHARRAGADEAILFDAEGRLVEAIAGNLVVFVDGRVVTPARRSAGVAGVGLQALTERLGVPLGEAELYGKDLGRAEAVMVINSVAGIRPAQRLDDRRLAIPGEARRWQRLWDELFACED